MAQQRFKTLLVTADLGHLKAYRLIQNDGQPGRPHIERIQTETTDATSHLSEVVTDQAGQFRKGSFPAGPNDRSDGEPHNLTLERRRRALKAIVRDISRLIAREKPQKWLLAAGKEINERLIEALDANARARLKQNVQANLTKLGSAQMLAHFHGENVILPKNNLKPANRSGQTQASGGRVREYNVGSSERQTQDLGPTEVEEAPGVSRSQSWNRRAGRQSLVGVNGSNVRRKPSARRTSPFKQMMRKQTISPAVAKVMRERREKGDKRRSVAQRRVTRSARTRMSQRRTERVWNKQFLWQLTKSKRIPTVNVAACIQVVRWAAANSLAAVVVAVKVAKPAGAIRAQIREARLAARVGQKGVNSAALLVNHPCCREILNWEFMSKLKLKPINEQVMVITGASSGIGLATAKLAAQKGAMVLRQQIVEMKS
jgi:hypothetical protein